MQDKYSNQISSFSRPILLSTDRWVDIARLTQNLRRALNGRKKIFWNNYKTSSLVIYSYIFCMNSISEYSKYVRCCENKYFIRIKFEIIIQNASKLS